MSAARSHPVADPDVDLGDLTGRLRLVATRLARLLRQQSDSTLSPTQLSALSTIQRRGPLTLGTLAEIERVAPPTITKVVDKLGDAGLVEREVDAADRRITRVRASAAGIRLLEEGRARKDAWLATQLAGLDPRARERLADAVDVLETLARGDRP